MAPLSRYPDNVLAQKVANFDGRTLSMTILSLCPIWILSQSVRAPLCELTRFSWHSYRIHLGATQGW